MLGKRKRGDTPQVTAIRNRLRMNQHLAKNRKLWAGGPKYVVPSAAATIRVGGWASPASGGELKFFDKSANINPPSGSDAWNIPAAATLLNGIGGGSNANQRVGRKVTLKSLMFRYRFSFDASVVGATATGGGNLRILIVYDKQPNANFPPVLSVLQNDFFNTMNNLDNRDRFVILADEYSDGISVNGTFSVTGKRYIKLNHEMVFNAGDNADSIGTIQTGAIYLMFAQTGTCIVDNASALDFSWASRIRYEDK